MYKNIKIYNYENKYEKSKIMQIWKYANIHVEEYISNRNVNKETNKPNKEKI